MIALSEELVSLVQEFLHREVGEDEDDAAVDAVTLLTLIRSWERDMTIRDLLTDMAEATDWFSLFYDPETEQQPSEWHVSLWVEGRGMVDIYTNNLADLQEEVLRACGNTQ